MLKDVLKCLDRTTGSWEIADESWGGGWWVYKSLHHEISKVFTFLGVSQGLEDGQGEEGEEGDVLHCSSLSLSVETVQCSADQASSLAFYNPSTDQALCVMPGSSQAPLHWHATWNSQPASRIQPRNKNNFIFKLFYYFGYPKTSQFLHWNTKTFIFIFIYYIIIEWYFLFFLALEIWNF